MIKPCQKLILCCLLCFVVPLSLANDPAGRWVLIDTDALTLTVMEGERTLSLLRNISIGRNGASYIKQKGDDKTPLGRFKVAWINDKSKYYRFFGLTYPGIEHAKIAYGNGVINEETYHSLIRARIFGETPPQNTPLGGQIGIHGIGLGDAKIHSTMNWTHGCVALTNEQIDELSRWIGKGTVVIIR